MIRSLFPGWKGYADRAADRSGMPIGAIERVNRVRCCGDALAANFPGPTPRSHPPVKRRAESASYRQPYFVSAACAPSHSLNLDDQKVRDPRVSTVARIWMPTFLHGNQADAYSRIGYLTAHIPCQIRRGIHVSCSRGGTQPTNWLLARQSPANAFKSCSRT